MNDTKYHDIIENKVHCSRGAINGLEYWNSVVDEGTNISACIKVKFQHPNNYSNVYLQMQIKKRELSNCFGSIDKMWVKYGFCR